MKAAIIGIAGTGLSEAEATLLRLQPPAGVILFGRNVADPIQLTTLTADLRRTLPPDAVIMVDQEGGRVARLKPPHWAAHPPAAAIGRAFGQEAAAGLRAAWLTGALIGWDCAAAGIDIACAPVLDLRMPGAHDVVGDRSYGENPDSVAQLARAMAGGLLAAGVQPVGKHAPGHGRARVDSHLSLPVIEAADLSADLLPFARNTDLPWMMTAHIIYQGWDDKTPATLSPIVINEVIRGRIGYHGLLLSDDLAMHALAGTPAERAAACLAAGCDIAMYCPGDPAGNAAVLDVCPTLPPAALHRMAAAKSLAQTSRLALDPLLLRRERDGILG
jgi:beta-N-acetylhexosaminidase